MTHFKTLFSTLALALCVTACGDDAGQTPPPAETPDAAATPQTTVPDAEQQLADQAEQTVEQAQDQADQLVNNENVTKAQELLAQLKTYIEENKYDLATDTLNQLDKIKASLPESMQGQIEQARNLVNAAKAKDSLEKGEGLQLPSF